MKFTKILCALLTLNLRLKTLENNTLKKILTRTNYLTRTYQIFNNLETLTPLIHILIVTKANSFPIVMLCPEVLDFSL